jgi:hypothetical protein
MTAWTRPHPLEAHLDRIVAALERIAAAQEAQLAESLIPRSWVSVFDSRSKYRPYFQDDATGDVYPPDALSVRPGRLGDLSASGRPAAGGGAA